MKLNELADNAGAPQGAQARRPRHRLGQGQDRRARRQGPEGALGRRHQRLRGRPDAAHRRLPKRGFNNIFAKDFDDVSLGRIQEAIDAGRLDAKATVDAAALIEAGVIRRAKDGVRAARQRRAQGEAHASRSPAPPRRPSRRSRRPAARSSCRSRQQPSRASPTKRRPHGRRLHLEEPAPISGFGGTQADARLSGVVLHGIGSRTTCRQSEFRRLRQGGGAEEAHLVHAGALLVYRLGTYIPLPGINPDAFAQAFQQQSSGMLGMFNMFAGGAVERMAIFALGIMPYISASIIMQLMTSVIPSLER